MKELFGKEYDANTERCHGFYKTASSWGFYLALRPKKGERLDWS